jgi:hypothetical protein
VALFYGNTYERVGAQLALGLMPDLDRTSPILAVSLPLINTPFALQVFILYNVLYLLWLVAFLFFFFFFHPARGIKCFTKAFYFIFIFIVIFIVIFILLLFFIFIFTFFIFIFILFLSYFILTHQAGQVVFLSFNKLIEFIANTTTASSWILPFSALSSLIITTIDGNQVFARFGSEVAFVNYVQANAPAKVIYL